MAVSKRMRYEVLRRDNHTCRYCGAAAPDVKLTVDHVLPVALGGTDDPTNLVAACGPCNSGKSSTSPDAPLVAEVEEKALTWGRAIDLALQRRAERDELRLEALAWFETEWVEGYDPASPLADDWRDSVTSFMSNGLPIFEVIEAIDIAHRAPIRAENIWKYFCGVCWRKVDDLKREAQQLIESGEVI